MDFRVRKDPSYIPRFDFCAGVPADASEQAEDACCHQKDLFLDRFDGQGASAQHATRCKNHADPQSAGRPQGVQRKRNAEQAVEVDHVWRGVLGLAPQLFEPPSMGDRGAIRHLDPVARVGDVGLDALER